MFVRRLWFVALLGFCLTLAVPALAVSKTDQTTDSQQSATKQQQSDADPSAANARTACNNKQSNGGHPPLVGARNRSYLIPAQKPSQTLASSLMGATMRNEAERIGTISDLILDNKYRLVGFVVDMSGETGLISKSVGVSCYAVTDIDVNKGVVEVDIKKQQLQDIREFITQKEVENKAKDEGNQVRRTYMSIQNP